MFGRRSPFRLLAAVIVALCGLVIPPAAGAAPTWEAPSPLFTPWYSYEAPALGAYDADSIVAAWVSNHPLGSTVMVASRPAGGSPNVQSVQGGAGAATQVSVAVNHGGDAIVAWRRQNGAVGEIWMTSRAAGGSFAPVQAIAAVAGKDTADPAVAIDDAGDAIVVWRQDNSNTDNKQTIYGAFRPAGGSFATAPVSSSDTRNQSPRVVLDDTGKATIAWSSGDGTTNVARAIVRDADGTLGAQRDLSPSTPAGYPMFATLALDGAGNVVSVFSHWNGSVYDVQGAMRPAGSDTWTDLPPFGESASPSPGSEPQVAMDPTGDAVALWRGLDHTIQASYRAPGGSFGPPQTGISGPWASNPRIVMDADGNATALWQRSDAGGSSIEAATRPRDGAFAGAETVSTGLAASPALAVDGLGKPFVAWTQLDATAPANSRSAVLTAAYVRSPLDVRLMLVPGNAYVDKPVAMSATSFDVDPPIKLAWHFGDGQSSTEGLSTTHTYRELGTYTVRFTATSGLNGATASRTATITVGPQPPPLPSAPDDAEGGAGSGSAAGGTETNATTPPPPDTPSKSPPPAPKVSASWKAGKTVTTLRSLKVSGLPKGAKLVVRCKGRGCPLSSKSLSVGSAGPRDLTSLINTTKMVGGKRRTVVAKLRNGAVVTVQVSVPGRAAQVVAFTMRAGKQPTRRVR